MKDAVITIQFGPRIEPKSVQIPATLSTTPGLAVHREVLRVREDGTGEMAYRSWNVTHVPSGLRIVTFAKRAQALKFCELASTVDWTQGEDSLLATADARRAAAKARSEALKVA